MNATNLIFNQFILVLLSTSRGEIGLEMVYERPKALLLFSERRGFTFWGSGKINIPKKRSGP